MHVDAPACPPWVEVIDNTIVLSGTIIPDNEVPRRVKMLSSGTDPESNITECTLVYEEQRELYRFTKGLLGRSCTTPAPPEADLFLIDRF